MWCGEISDALKRVTIMVSSDAYSKGASRRWVTSGAYIKNASLMWVSSDDYSQNASLRKISSETHFSGRIIDDNLQKQKKMKNPLLGSYIHHSCFFRSGNQILYTNYTQSNQILYTNWYTSAKKSHPPSNKSSSADCTELTRDSSNFPGFKFSVYHRF